LATRKPKIKPPEPPSSLHLWTPTDVAHWRDRLLKEQKGIDPITQEKITQRACLDHDHSKTGDSAQRVRGVLSSPCNIFEGKVKAVYRRYLKYSTDQPLNVILRNLAAYYEQDNSHLPLHPSWIKTVQSAFSALPEPTKAKVLKELGKENGANASQRKKIMLDCIKSKKFSYTYLMDLISKSKV
jgi:hypothetical protein